MELVSCPACGHAALLALGARLDHPYRWRPWVSVLTYLYLCDWCDALVALGSTRDPLVESLPGSAVLVGVRHRLKREPGYPTDRVADVEVRERTPDGFIP